MSLRLLNPFPKSPPEGDSYIYLFVVRRILNIVLELNPPLPLSKNRDLEMMGALVNAVNKFKAVYYAKYKQGIADFDDEELYVALGKELKEKNEAEFNKLIKELNDSQWTLLLTGKIYEVKAVGKKIDAALTELFTKDGIIDGAKQINTNRNRIGLGLNDNHFYLKDGQLHTILIYNNAAADKSTGVYIPKEFSQIEFIDGSESSVVCVNPTNKQVIRASHIRLSKHSSSLTQ